MSVMRVLPYRQRALLCKLYIEVAIVWAILLATVFYIAEIVVEHNVSWGWLKTAPCVLYMHCKPFCWHFLQVNLFILTLAGASLLLSNCLASNK